MENLPSILKQVADIGKAVQAIISCTSVDNVMRKAKHLELQELLDLLKYTYRVQGKSILVQDCISELQKTNMMIQRNGNTGTMRSYENGLLQLQYDGLCDLVKQYAQ